MKRLTVIALVTACGGAAKKATDTPGNEAAAAPLAPCPDDAALLTLATEIWAPSTDPENVWCLPIRVQGEPRWWVAGYAKTDEPEAWGSSPHQALLAAPDGAVIWKEASPWDEMYPDAQEPEAIDLDGDGSDEILYQSTYGEGGGSSTEVVVIGVAGARPVSGRVAIGWSNMDEGCDASWGIVDGRIDITGDGECASFTGRYRWNGTELVSE